MEILFVILGLVLFFLSLRWYGPGRRRKVKASIIRFFVQVDDGPSVLIGENMTTLVRNDQVLNFNPRFEDDHGNEADALGSTPSWTLSNPDIGELVVSEDGRAATFVPNGKKGVAQIGIIVDADPGAAEVPLVGTADVQVLSGLASVIKLEGVLAPKPVATPAPTDAPEPEPTAAPEPEPTAEPQPTDAPEATGEPDPAPTDAPAADPVADPAPVDGQGGDAAPVAEDDPNKTV